MTKDLKIDIREENQTIALNFANRLEKLAFWEYFNSHCCRPHLQIFKNNPHDECQLLLIRAQNKEDVGAYVSSSGDWVINFGTIKACNGFESLFNLSTLPYVHKQRSILTLNKQQIARIPTAHLQSSEVISLIDDIVAYEGFKYNTLSSTGKIAFIFASIITVGIFALGYGLYRFFKNVHIQEGKYFNSHNQDYGFDSDNTFLYTSVRESILTNHFLETEESARNKIIHESNHEMTHMQNLLKQECELHLLVDQENTARHKFFNLYNETVGSAKNKFICESRQIEKRNIERYVRSEVYASKAQLDFGSYTMLGWVPRMKLFDELEVHFEVESGLSASDFTSKITTILSDFPSLGLSRAGTSSWNGVFSFDLRQNPRPCERNALFPSWFKGCVSIEECDKFAERLAACLSEERKATFGPRR